MNIGDIDLICWKWVIVVIRWWSRTIDPDLCLRIGSMTSNQPPVYVLPLNSLLTNTRWKTTLLGCRMSTQKAKEFTFRRPRFVQRTLRGKRQGPFWRKMRKGSPISDWWYWWISLAQLGIQGTMNGAPPWRELGPGACIPICDCFTENVNLCQ